MSEEMNHNGMTPYETIKIAEMSQRGKHGAVAVTGLVIGGAALVTAAVGMVYAHGQAKKAQEVASAKNEGTAALLNQMAGLLAEERRERVQGDINVTANVTDTVSGQQSNSLTNQIENSAIAQATAQIMTGMMTGQYQQSPKRVSLWQEGPCNCPADNGCGCNR